MLLGYTMDGFKSFKNYTEVDLKKTQYQVLENTNVTNGVLKGCMFVGGNASGKTNAIGAIRMLLVLLFSRRDVRFDRFPCIFSDTGRFENSYTFLIDGSEICYQLRYQEKDHLLLEHLYVDSHLVLDRVGSIAHSELTETKEYFDIPSDSIFLRELWFNTKFRGHEVLQHWFDFLRNSKYINTQTHIISGVGMDKDMTLEQYLQNNGVDELNHFFEECGFGHSVIYRPEFAVKENELSGLYLKREGITQEFSYMIESLGNQTLLNILPSYLSVIKNGGMLICDEFSSALHNDLEELLVKHFMKNAKNAQMMIVSHSTNLLTSRLFRPDQLYAVNFDTNGSNLVRFSSEQPRTGQNYEKMYLGGVFSGLPRYNEN